MESLAKLSGLSQAKKDHLIHSLWSIIGELRQEVSGLREQAHRLVIEEDFSTGPSGQEQFQLLQASGFGWSAQNAFAT